jgi:hypothetical protein
VTSRPTAVRFKAGRPNARLLSEARKAIGQCRRAGCKITDDLISYRSWCCTAGVFAKSGHAIARPGQVSSPSRARKARGVSTSMPMLSLWDRRWLSLVTSGVCAATLSAANFRSSGSGMKTKLSGSTEPRNSAPDETIGRTSRPLLHWGRRYRDPAPPRYDNNKSRLGERNHGARATSSPPRNLMVE